MPSCATHTEIKKVTVEMICAISIVLVLRYNTVNLRA
jgi:hypothetical protein